MGDGARTTERLVLRPPRPADAPAYRALLMHPTIGESLRPPPLAPFVPADGDAWLDADARHWERFGFGPWAVVERAGGAYLGRVGLRWSEIGDRAGIEVLWSIDPARHGEGFAAEAAAAALDLAAGLELDEVFAIVLPTNAASRRVAEKIGMERAGNVEHAGLDHLLFRAAPSAARPA
ncbi:MAG TPA: GNAT family N-acetyltransferase [Solirubrobacterales bacterium]|nr:GNAT family N-acetyltransferase [Solirubrobacterales bacterium]